MVNAKEIAFLFKNTIFSAIPLLYSQFPPSACKRIPPHISYCAPFVSETNLSALNACGTIGRKLTAAEVDLRG